MGERIRGGLHSDGEGMRAMQGSGGALGAGGQTATPRQAWGQGQSLGGQGVDVGARGGHQPLLDEESWEVSVQRTDLLAPGPVPGTAVTRWGRQRVGHRRAEKEQQGASTALQPEKGSGGQEGPPGGREALDWVRMMQRPGRLPRTRTFSLFSVEGYFQTDENKLYMLNTGHVSSF